MIMGPLLPLMWFSSCWVGVNSVQLLGKTCKHAAEIGHYLLNLIYRRIWERTQRIMKDGPLGCPVVPKKDGALTYNLGVVTFPDNFRFPSVPDPFMRADEDLG